jgi:hypothetical protein
VAVVMVESINLSAAVALVVLFKVGHNLQVL